ncbi:MAG TPA: polysaccharide deacetylase family protein, partial [Bacillota bacterium]|nr:polysaccharide deacetylase family protein [Bacillota bacterium]
MLRSILLLTAAAFSGLSASAVQWTWTWQPAPGEPVPTAEVCAFKYGKAWAYALEIDDGPKWVRSFAVPFLAQYHYTDAPPGVPGGVRRPFVGSVSVIVAAIGNNPTAVSWDDLNALLDSGWGVMNHSFDHRANSWSGEAAKLNDAQVREDAFWSQAILAAKLPGGRAPTGAAYANGYTDYNRHDALAACGISIATRVGGSSPRDVLSPRVKWMDFTRSYLDENVWKNEWNKSKPMADFPGADQDGPATNNLVIDFTHGIERDAGSANQQRWRTRLKTIESRWGAGGADSLWCAPTAEVADYVRAAKAA